LDKLQVVQTILPQSNTE